MTYTFRDINDKDNISVPASSNKKLHHESIPKTINELVNFSKDSLIEISKEEHKHNPKQYQSSHNLTENKQLEMKTKLKAESGYINIPKDAKSIHRKALISPIGPNNHIPTLYTVSILSASSSIKGKGVNQFLNQSEVYTEEMITESKEKIADT